VNIYRERVLPSAPNLALPILLFLSVLTVMIPISIDWALPVAFVFSAIFVLIIFSASPTITVTEATLTSKNAIIDRKFLGEATVITKSQQFEELGQRLDARAWLAIQASVKGLVKVQVNDPEDPTPYWLISTRNPEKLAKLLGN
jgi:hypothetical protein